jgi:glutamate/tyrosine decarboxylase-like PLP-dependent enzyme
VTGPPPPGPAASLPAWFLGPRAENADLVERLLLEALRDHVAWRRGYHPEDEPAIPDAERCTAGYGGAVGRLVAELDGLLTALKRDVPLFSGRYLGHMVGEQTIAAQLGYFAGMLYNPNNVVAEVSPVTTELELEVAAQLAAMIGYDPVRAWGHLTSGGTIANFEALWIARGVRYLPVGLALAARELAVAVPAQLPDGTVADLRDLPIWSLLNLDPDAALDAYDAFHHAVPAEAAREAIDRHSLSAVGYQDYTRRLAAVWSDPLPPGVVLVASTAHYSWEKIVRALGIGSRRLIQVPVDAHARMDPGALVEALAECSASRTPVLAVVSVCGSTEEGAVDRLHEVQAVRAEAARHHGTVFHLHADACHGGYAAALTRAPDGGRLTAAALQQRTGTAWPDDDWVAAISALAHADSVTIDPHKMGYVPYPAGVFLLRDRRGRNLVSLEPPYLAPDGGMREEDAFLGRWILEGSKPGAAAAAVWLSHRVLSLDADGYGVLVERTAAGARALHAALGATHALGACRAVRLPAPDLNLVTWVVTHPSCTTLASINALNEAIHRQLSGAAGRPAYWLTRTRLEAPGARGIVTPLLRDLGVTGVAWDAEGLVVLRATVMDPWFAHGGTSPDHCAGVVRAVAEAAERALGSD